MMTDEELSAIRVHVENDKTHGCAGCLNCARSLLAEVEFRGAQSNRNLERALKYETECSRLLAEVERLSAEYARGFHDGEVNARKNPF